MLLLTAVVVAVDVVQPASPKYDERSFFFSGVGTSLATPAATIIAAAANVPPGSNTGQSTEPRAEVLRSSSGSMPPPPPPSAAAARRADAVEVGVGVNKGEEGFGCTRMELGLAASNGGGDAAAAGDSSGSHDSMVVDEEDMVTPPAAPALNPSTTTAAVAGGGTGSGADPLTSPPGFTSAVQTPKTTKPSAAADTIRAAAVLPRGPPGPQNLRPLRTPQGPKPPVSQLTLPHGVGAGGSYPSGSKGGGGPTPPSQLGFKQHKGSGDEGPQLGVLGVEVHADSRGRLLPDPR